MKSKFLSASVLAVAALASASSFADSGDFYPPTPVAQTSTTTRAEVQAELRQAQRAGYMTHFASDSIGPQFSVTQQASSKTRAEVKAETLAARPFSTISAIENGYPIAR